MNTAAAEIQVIRREVEDAANVMISATTDGLALMGKAREGDPRALDALEAALYAILEACAFQDIVGQRLSRLSEASLGRPGAADPLLNGPADPGQGLDQAAADRLFDSESEG